MWYTASSSVCLLINYFWFLNLFIRKTLQTSRIKAQGICSKTIDPSLGYGPLGRVYPGLSLRKTTSGRNLLRNWPTSTHSSGHFLPVFISSHYLKIIIMEINKWVDGAPAYLGKVLCVCERKQNICDLRLKILVLIISLKLR